MCVCVLCVHSHDEPVGTSCMLLFLEASQMNSGEVEQNRKTNEHLAGKECTS